MEGVHTCRQKQATVGRTVLQMAGLTPGQLLDAVMHAQSGGDASSSGAQLGGRHVIQPVELPAERVIQEVPRAVPTEVEVVREVPKEVVREVIKEVVKEVPVEVPVEVIREVPVEIVRTVVKEVPKETIKEVPVEVIKEVRVRASPEVWDTCRALACHHVSTTATTRVPFLCRSSSRHRTR